jgi:hypothetical protein
MRRIIGVAVVLLVLVNLAAVAYRMGWLPIPALARLASSSSTPATPAATAVSVSAQVPDGTALPSIPAPDAPGQPAAAAAAAVSQAPAASATDAKGAALIPPPAFAGNVASADFGGTVETWTTDVNSSPDHQEVIDGNPESNWVQWTRGKPHPGEFVLSFFAREPMLIDRIVIRSGTAGNDSVLKLFPKEIEIWTSMAPTADGPFEKVASAALPPVQSQKGEAVVSFSPVEARFLKFRALTNQADATDFALSEMRVMEAQRSGYVPLVSRHPELQWPGGPNGLPPVRPTGADGAVCAPPEAPVPPAHAESRRVVLLGEQRGSHLAGALFEHSRFAPAEEDAARRRVEFALNEKDVAAVEDDVPVEEKGVLLRARYRFVYPRHARPALLAPAVGFDTVVMAQMCDGNSRMGALSPAFKQALVAWVAAGGKLIVQDSDDCLPGPDYSFIPFRFKTDTPGARGAEGFDLRFVETNAMLQDRAGRPGFLDVDAWVNNKRLYRNELGDASVFVAWDANWCGQLAVRNVHKVMGFALAYARYGRGLIIYDGFDNDQNLERGYDQMVIRQLSQAFGPHSLPCAARLGDFVLTTPTSLLQRAAVPGRTYTYPLTLLSNLGYQGTVTFSASLVGGVTGVDSRFEPATVVLAGESASALSVTLPGALPTPSFAVQVRGTDAAGKNSSLCLQFGPATSGELSVVSTLAPPTKTRKNLEIILDASGSMKTLLAGQKTRWDVALETLDHVLRSLPDDFNVGLRIYGHRETSRSPRTCMDSELVVPIRKLDRNAILNSAKRFKPKGETPLVYSALQSPADLKAVGGGTVVLITDGEESCKGDTVKAAADLKASGLDIRLNIVGFALKNPKVQKDLAGFSEATGGLFYSADTGGALADAVMVAAVEKFPYTVYDAAGKAVLTGEAGGGADQLPAGDYKVVVTAGTKELVAPRVSVGLGQSVTLTIAMKSGQLTLQ